MKVEFETQHGEFLLVKLPYTSINPDIRSLGPYNVVYFEPSDEETEFTAVNFYKDKVLIIGFVKDLTEEQWSEVVDSGWYSVNGVRFDGFIDYSKRIEGYADEVILSAVDSGKSLMDSLGVYLKNPKSPNKEDDYEQYVYNQFEERTGNWLLIKYL
jgi:hypothetical protein